MSECFTWFLISGLGLPNVYQNLMRITMCGGIYDIVVIFDFEVFLGGNLQGIGKVEEGEYTG